MNVGESNYSHVLITTTADHILNYFFYFSEKTKLDISCESSARQMIHM